MNRNTVLFCWLFIIIILKMQVYSKKPTTLKIVNYTPMCNIQAISGNDKEIWFATSGGAVRYSTLNGRFKFYQMTDGLSSNIVNDVLIDSTDKVWFATNHGITHFDGIKWTTIDSVSDSLPGNKVNCITQDQNGQLWFGTDRGICTLKNQRWQLYNAANSGLANNFINALCFDPKGHLWIANKSCLTEYDENHWVNHGLSNNYQVENVCVPDTNIVLFGNLDGIKFRKNSYWNYINTSRGLPNDNVKTFFIESPTKIWIGTAGGLALFEDFNSVKKIFPSDKMINRNIQAIYIDKMKLFWIGSSDGIYLFDGVNTWKKLLLEFPMPNFLIYGICVEGHKVWVGTNLGMFYLENQQFLPVHWSDGDSIQAVHFLDSTKPAGLYFTTKDYIGRIRNNRLEKVVTLSNCPLDNNLKCIFETSNQHLWCGSEKGCVIYDGEKWNNYQSKYKINDIIEDKNGEIWLATTTGVVRNGLSAIEEYLPVRSFSSAVMDDKGTLYFGSELGLCTFLVKRKEFQILEDPPKVAIRTLAIDNTGSIYGGMDDGLFIYDRKQTLRTIKESDGLIQGSINTMAIDQDGKIWLNSNQGISCLIP